MKTITAWTLLALLTVACGGETITGVDSPTDAAAGGSAGATSDASTGGTAGTTSQDAGPAGSGGSPVADASTGGHDGGHMIDGGPPHDGSPFVDATTDVFDCAAARAKYQQAFDAAIACNPAINAIQCTDKVKVTDLCGCPVAGNIMEKQKVKRAQNMYKYLIEANGCELDCDKACYGGPQWGCDPNSNTCSPAWEY